MEYSYDRKVWLQFTSLRAFVGVLKACMIGFTADGRCQDFSLNAFVTLDGIDYLYRLHFAGISKSLIFLEYAHLHISGLLDLIVISAKLKRTAYDDSRQ